jgi:hypothetical protein
MPLGQPALPDSTIAVIREWIASGASRAASAVAGSFAVQTVSVAPTEIAIATTQPVDSSLVNATTVMLRRSAMASGDPDAVTARVTVSPVNDSLVLLVPDHALAPGQYLLTLRGTGAAALADWNATVIDGNGDGAAGGDYVQTVSIGGAP